MIRRTVNYQRGFILPVVLFTLVALSFMILALSSSVYVNYNRAARERYNVNAQLSADAGFDDALIKLTNDRTWAGSGGEIELLNSSGIRSTFETTVINGATDNEKIISSVAKVYSPATSSSPTVTRKFEIDVEGIGQSLGDSSVVTGVGGLILNNNAKISGGDVLVNGKITMGNNSQIGLSINPVNVRVAHQSCPVPPDSTFPRVCASGENGQPISIGNNGRIYGDVRATNQTTGTNMTDPGLIAGETFDPISLPDYDRDGQKAAVTTTLASSSSIIACGNNQTKTWPANLKITGNFTPGNNCTINITGDVWLTGNASGGNNARYVISDSVGTDRPVMMVDGSSGLTLGNNMQVVPNNVGTGIEVIAYWSADSCSPDCANVTGSALSNSQNVTTIDLSNNGSAQNSIFYARWSKVVVSNNGGLGAVAGQTVQLGENAVISFTAFIEGSDNEIVAWVKRGYMRVKTL